uniref:Phenolic oxidative coupling protein POCP3 n=1 Tax=Hypericum tomentosum TaxID=1137039 RepID=A0A1C9KD15_9ROSI|nr:phenolic oxidative coupling protein POCP3 [Hypericum tomentosum]
MGFSLSQDITSPIPPERLFKALVTERHLIVPKLMPNVFKSMEIVEGDGGAGTIRKATFAEGLPFKSMSQRIDVLDTKNYYCKFTLFEGGMLGDTLDSIVHELKLDPLGDGCKGKMSSHYVLKPGATINEEEVKVVKQKAYGLVKAVEEYLLNNPDVLA